MTDHNREERIEAEVFKIESTHHFHGDTCLCGFTSPRSRSRTEHITGLMRAVFEQAHTPTAEEREALEFAQAQWPDLGVGGDADYYNKIARARFLEGVEWQTRRTVQGEPTDAEVDAALSRAEYDVLGDKNGTET